jgi:hypothetical protein
MIYLRYQYNLKVIWAANAMLGVWKQRTRRIFFKSRFKLKFETEYIEIHKQWNYVLRRNWTKYTTGPRTLIILVFMPELGRHAKTASDLNLGRLLPALTDKNVKIILVLRGFNASIRNEYDYLISLGAPDPHPMRDGRIQFIVPETADHYKVPKQPQFTLVPQFRLRKHSFKVIPHAHDQRQGSEKD